VRIAIAEDSVLLRSGLVRLLSDAGEELVAEAGDGVDLIEAVARKRPDLPIVDVRMPPTYRDEGIRAALELRKRHPETAVLVLSQYVEEEYASELVADHPGGVGYLLKDRVADVAEFVESARRVAAGGTVLDPEVVSQLLVRSRRRDPLDRLTDRERAVLSLMAEGCSNNAIAAALTVSAGAVEKHIGNILTKLDLPPTPGDHRRVLAVLRYLES
jgi:DNA-binding NarL/FixJ family response regulator